MFDMLVVQSNGGLTPLTPVSTLPGGHHHHPTDLSPRSARSTSSSLMSDSPTSSSPTPTTPIKDFHSQLHQHHLPQEGKGVGFEDFSALQRLQYALERNSLFSNLFQTIGPNGKMSPNQTELSLKTSRRHEVDEDEQEVGRENENLNVSLEDSGPRSTDSSSNLIDTPTGSPTTNPTNIFQCPACSIVCSGRHSFNEHLVTHTNQYVCPKCDYLTSTEENMRDHLQEVHDLTESNGLTDDEGRVPKMNSQGKMKTFKCKQCQHISITKMEFWAHSKSHIRPEKMLTCPKCSFVTEYKHHLEYHLRNHFRSKPFQCTECSYSCVNKSMLNSHLKSHSTVYQYRCADCSYATKYCHSLKLHLRKYSHNPSAVLNPDGSQNPLTIIDVYGTRRGPKIKRPAPRSDTKITQSLQSQVSPNSTDGCEDVNKGEDYNSEISPTSAITKKESNINLEQQITRFSSDTSDSMSDTELRHQHTVTHVTDVNRTNFSQFQNPIHISDPKGILEQMSGKSPLEFYAAALNQYIFANPILCMQPVQDLAKRVAKEQQDQLLSHVFAAAQQKVQSQQAEIKISHHPAVHNQSSHTPLDLRQNSGGHRQNGNGNVNVKLEVDERERHYEGQNSEDMKKRKRKGKAHRYDRQLIAEDFGQQEEGKALDFSNNNNNSKIEKKDISNLICKYCEISFLDQVLYSMHMSYHSGDADPFLCRSCGKNTPNKIAFSVHLTTDPH